jgi:hypothetical protein
MGTKVYDNYADLITFNRNSRGTALRPIGYGDELVTNGTFDTDTAGWSVESEVTAVIDTTVFANGGIKLTNTVTGSVDQQVYQTISGLTAGKVYEVSADAYTPSTNTNNVATISNVSVSYNSSNASSTTEEDQIQKISFVFTASSTSVTVYLSVVLSDYSNFGDENKIGYFDNISVKEVLFDREGDPLTLFLHPEGVPRIEYDADRNLKGLLIEPEAWNYDTASSTIIAWSLLNITKSADQTTAPDGVAASADSVLETVANNTHFIYNDYAPGAGSYVFSCFVKSIGGRNFQLTTYGLGGGSGGASVQFNLSTGTVASGTGTITEIGDGWYRVSGSAVTTGATGMRVIAYSVDGTANTFTGDVTKGFYMWGMQVEAGPIATSYMPTTGSPFTRGKDEATMTNVSGLIGQKEGTLYVEVDFRTATGAYQHILNVNDGTPANRILIWVFGGNTLMYIDSNGSLVLNTGASSLSNGVQKLAFAYANGDQEFYRNGSSIATGTASLAALATLTDIDLGQSELSASQANMWIRAIQIIPRRLSDEQLIELTS